MPWYMIFDSLVEHIYTVSWCYVTKFQAVLALYAARRTSGIVVNIGFHVTSIVPSKFMGHQNLNESLHLYGSSVTDKSPRWTEFQLISMSFMA